MEYCNPLHIPVPTRCQSSFSSLIPSQPSSEFLYPRRYRIPQEAYSPSSKWKASMARSWAHSSITFDLVGYFKQGVPMRELSVRSIHTLNQMIAGATDMICHQQKLVFKIRWPGYPHVDWTRSINLWPNGAPITRAQLGSIVAQNFARFVEKGQYDIAQNPQWQLGAQGITFDSLILVALVNVCDDIWMADCAFDSR